MMTTQLSDNEKYHLLCKQYSRDISRLTEALKDLYNSNCGLPKSCGHEFTCTCPGDKAKELLEIFDD